MRVLILSLICAVMAHAFGGPDPGQIESGSQIDGSGAVTVSPDRVIPDAGKMDEGNTGIPPTGQASMGGTPEARVLAVLAGCKESRSLGKQAADSLHSSKGWFWGGVGSGFLFPPVGTGVLILMALQPVESPVSIPTGVEEDCYRRGYQSMCHQKDVAYALLGGALGTGVVIAIVLLFPPSISIY